MMFFLFQYIIINILNLRITIGKNTVSFLSVKFTSCISFVIYEFGGIVFNISY